MHIDIEEYFKCLHQSYMAMGERVQTYSINVFGDFKLFGAIAAILSWKPISNQIEGLKKPETVFLGFFAIAIIIVIVQAYSLLKLSLARYYMCRLKDLELALSELSPNHPPKAFTEALHWPAWYNATHRMIVRIYFSLIYGTVILFPSAILYRSVEKPSLALIYFSVTLALAFIMYRATLRLYRVEANPDLRADADESLLSAPTSAV